MIFPKTNINTEREARDKQDKFGHGVDRLDLEIWLKKTYSSESFKFKRFKTIAERFLSSKIGLEILEIGSSIGDFSFFCLKNFPHHRYTMSDISDKSFLKYKKTIIDFFNIEKKDLANVNFISFSAEEIPFSSNIFDIVIIRASVHHFENQAVAFEKIRKCLKPSGKLVFFNEPVCLSIPVYKFFYKLFNGLEGRKKGYNDHVFTKDEYLNFGEKYSKREVVFDELYVNEFLKHHNKRKGFKKIISNIIVKNKKLLHAYLIYKYKAPIIFIFHK